MIIRFDFYSSLKHHYGGTKEFVGFCKGQCDRCDLTFDSHTKMKKHKVLAHGSIFKIPTKYTCDICGRTYKNGTLLRTHILTHNDKDIICDFCGMGFNSVKRLNDHSIVHMPKTIKCTFDNCDCMFATEKKLKVHTRLIHSKKWLEKSNEKKFKCVSCSKMFRANRDLQRHISVVHLGERLKCEQCDFEAKYKNILKDHIEIVHEGRMFQCEVPGCGKQMNRKENINKHMKTSHGIPLPHERKGAIKKKFIDDI